MLVSRNARKAFTLVEMLVVVAIIGILASLLMPGLQKAYQGALGLSCQNNQRQLMSSFLMFSGDHDMFLPGNYNDWTYSGSEAYKQNWLQGGAIGGFRPGLSQGPQNGTIFPYTGNSYELYRCRAETPGVINSGVGSNGRFDYHAVLVFAGARVTAIKGKSRVRQLGVWNYDFRTPVISEPQPAYYINRGGGNGALGPPDRFSDRHNGSANIASIDGSVYAFPIVGDYTITQDWSSIAPSGNWRLLASFTAGWGYWQAQ